MAIQISDLHIRSQAALPTPRQLHNEFPPGPGEASYILQTRQEIIRILDGQDDRLMVVTGPCSIHEPESALEYARRLQAFAPQVADALCLIMRVYFEKPRTRMGWKGLIYDPDLDGSGDIQKGLRLARQILIECAQIRIPAASEILDLVTPQYYAELLAWGAIGARTTESPLHRQMASALSAPVGFKNGMSGSIRVAADAILVASQSHTFPSISMDGQALVVTTTGNPHCHLILRGGENGPNFEHACIKSAAQELAEAGLRAQVMVDCSHGNSGKDYRRQLKVAADLELQVRAGSGLICGLMLESHLEEGRQDIRKGRQGLRFGQSVTDACLGWDQTTGVLGRMADAVRARRERGQPRIGQPPMGH